MKIDSTDLAKYVATRLIHWLLSLIVVVIAIGLIAVAAHCQHLALHTDEDEWEDAIGVKFITVTSTDKDLIYYYVTRKYERRLSSIGWDDKTIVRTVKDKQGKTVVEGCYMMIYCRKHLMAYVLNQIKCKEASP